MFKYVKKFQKQIMVVLGVGCMITFIVQLVKPPGKSLGLGDRVLGTLDGKPVTQSEMHQARDEWQTLKALIFADPNNPEAHRGFLSVVLGDLATVINQKQDTFFLLVQEANRQAILLRGDELRSIFTNNTANMPPEGSENRDFVEHAVFDCLMVRRMLDRDQDVAKATVPLRRWLLARDRQDISLNVVTVAAASFLPKVPAPTDEQIRNQYDSYSDRIRGQAGAADDPLEFGYKLAKRVKLQFIGLKEAELLRCAQASKSKQDWYVAAYGEFMANRDQYDRQPVPMAATQPASRPSAAAAATSTRPSSGPSPAVQKLDDPQADFALHVPIVLERLYQDQASDLRDNILKHISDALDTGYGEWRDAQAGEAGATGGAATRAGSAAFTSQAFILDLARAIQKQYGVLPVTGNIDQLKDRQALADVEGIGTCFWISRGQVVDFPDYAVLEPAEGGLSPWQPSTVFQNASGDVYIFRISQIDPPHTPPLSEIKDLVVSDWKQAAAYKMALDAARDLLADGQKRGLTAAAQTAGDSMIVTDLFQPSEVLGREASRASIAPLNLKRGSVLLLAQASQQLLSEPRTAEGRPVSIAELWPDAVAAVIQLRQAVPLWNSQNPGLDEARIMFSAVGPQRARLMADLVSFNSVAQRLNFKLDVSATTQP